MVFCGVEDVEVVFEAPDCLWSTKAEFSPSDIHKQVFIFFFQFLSRIISGISKTISTAATAL